VLANGKIHDRLVAFLLGSPDRYGWWAGRYVLRPDHLHLLAMQAPEAVPLGEWIKALKAFIANREFRWQESHFDHVLRSDESETEKWEYVRQNPVRADLVTDAEHWPYAGEFNWNDERPHRVR
jgi:REP-associated tyrosine transposase